MTRTEAHKGLQLERDIETALRTAGPDGTKVVTRPRFDSAEADFLVTTPDGPIFLIEVKTGLGAARLGSVAQLAAYSDVFRRSYGDAMIPILVAVGPDAVALREAATDFGIEVIAGEDVGRVTDALARRVNA